MELFLAAGIELPPTGGRARRTTGALARTLRVPLFNYKVVDEARGLAAFAPTPEQVAAAADYARKVKSPKFLKHKETAVRPVFIELSGKLENWHELDFAGFLADVRKAFHADILVKQRGEWEAYVADNAREVHALTAQITGAEQEIDRVVYDLFDLTSGEIALLESSVAGKS